MHEVVKTKSGSSLIRFENDVFFELTFYYLELEARHTKTSTNQIN